MAACTSCHTIELIARLIVIHFFPPLLWLIFLFPTGFDDFHRHSASILRRAVFGVDSSGGYMHLSLCLSLSLPTTILPCAYLISYLFF